MSDARPPGAFRFAPRTLAPPGSLAAEAFLGGPAAGLFRAVVTPQSDIGLELPGGPGRVGSEAFAATSPQARAKLEVILRGGGQLVTTGQQPGLFLGPLYTLYKTVSAIQLATHLERSTGRPTLAAFWVAADDHDWEEIGTCQVLALDESATTLRLDPPEGRKGRSVGETLLPDSIVDLAERLGELVGSSPVAGDDRAGFLEFVKTAYRPGETVSAAFVSTMVQVFANHDLVLVDSSHAAIRQTAAKLYGEIVQRPADVANAMASGGERVRQAGYPIQLNPPEAGLQIFFDEGSARRHVLATPNGFTIGGSDDWSREEFAALINDQPSSFTPAAALRPVLESWLLPVAATVLGPGELSYWAQLEPLFVTLNVWMPAVRDRGSWFLIESRVERLLLKMGVDATLIETNVEELRRRVLEAGRPEGVARALSQLDGDIAARFLELESTGDNELPGLKSAVGKARHGVERVLDDLRRVVDQRVSERESASMEQVRRLVANLAPGGNSQERTLGAASFLAKYGPELVDQLIENSDVAGPQGQD
ncbi:MAG: bacillithiol biosynthesis cysteine-adding enzyme BshC [Gemmatimonadales bacterium]|nr:MAG: bacillithiol biosynthesis cysteine-adding enzyme BshC [Gemmatimonadales bacterium]